MKSWYWSFPAAALEVVAAFLDGLAGGDRAVDLWGVMENQPTVVGIKKKNREKPLDVTRLLCNACLDLSYLYLPTCQYPLEHMHKIQG